MESIPEGRGRFLESDLENAEYRQKVEADPGQCEAKHDGDRRRDSKFKYSL